MARGVYRHLVKAVRRHVMRDNGNTQFHNFIRDEFRNNGDLKDSSTVQQKLNLARDYAFLVRSVHAHKELLVSYNIGVDREVEQSLRLKNTAQRVGLSMPKLFDGDEPPK